MSNSGHTPSSWRCGKCIKKYNTLSALGQAPSDHGQPSSQLRQVSGLQALTSARELPRKTAHSAKRRKLDGVTRNYEMSPDQGAISIKNSDGCESYIANVTQGTGLAGTNPRGLELSKPSQQTCSAESILVPRVVSKVVSPLPQLSVKCDASRPPQDHPALDPRTGALRKTAEKDSHLLHLMREVGAGRASKRQLEEFSLYVVTLCGSPQTQAKTSAPESPKAMSEAAFEGHIEVDGTEGRDSHNAKRDENMSFDETQAAQRRFIDPQSNELSPPYSPLPAQLYDRGIPGQADAAIQVDIQPEKCEQPIDESIVAESTRIVEPSSDKQVQTDRPLSLDSPLVPLATCSKCNKRVFSCNTKSIGLILW